MISALSLGASAQSGPTSFGISGTLYNASGDLIAQTGVNFQVEILAKTTTPAKTCVLYSELHSNQDLSQTKGGFAFEVGNGDSRQNFLESTTALSSKIFENNGSTGNFTGCTGGGITLNSGDQRYVRISYDIGGGLIAMDPIVPIDAASYSTVAETLQGKRPEDFLQVHNDGSSVFLDQTNLEFPYSSTNWPKFQALLNGTSTQYIPAAPGSTVDLNGQVLTNIAVPATGTDAANKNYVDGSIGGKIADLTGIGPATGDGDTLIWDQGANKWKVGTPAAIDNTKLPLVGGTMAGPITMGGFDLYNTGHITMAPQHLLNLGTFTSLQEGALSLGTADKGKILYNTDLGEIRVWNGSAFGGTSPVTSVNGKTGEVSLNVMDIYMAGTAGLWDVGTAPKNVVQLDNDGHLPAVDGSALTNIVSSVAGRTGDVTLDVSDIQSATGKYFAYQPNGAACVDGEILKWNSTRWECAADSSGIGDITDVNAGNGLLGGGTSGSVTLSVNVGTGSNQIVQLDSASRLPAVDGSALTNINGASIDGSTLTNVNAVRIQGYAVSATAPTGGYVLQYNSTSTQWESVAIPSAPVSTVAGRTGDVTLDVSDLQSATGKYFTYQPNGTACADGEILKWNSTRWECAADSSGTGDITDVNAGNGLLGGGTSGSVTLSVNIGTGSNQIVQLDNNGHLPAVDGSALTNINGSSIDGSTLTNVNAIRLQSRAISSTQPNDNEVLTWNNTTSTWEPRATSTTGITELTGDVLAAGTGSVAATISENAITSAKINNTGNTQNRLLITDSTSGTLVTYKTCALNEILKWNSTGWECAADSTGTGDITDVNAGNGLLGGGTSGSVTLSVNIGTGSNQIVQLDSLGRLPALDGSALTNINGSSIDGSTLTNLNAVRLQTYAISNATPNPGQVLTWNGTTSQWEPQTSVASSTINSITAGTGATGGGTTGDVTIGVDVGTGSNQIVQLDNNGHLPAVDGSALTNINGASIDGSTLTNVNAVRIQGYAVSATAPTGGYVLQYNSTSTQWESVAIPSAPVSTVAGRTGDVTLDVSDIQSASGKYFTYQPNGTACSTGEILKWNSSHWECAADSSGTGDITDVNAGNGLLGGGTSGSVTLSVNIGTGSNQIVQLDNNGHLPAVDGSALTNINGSSIDGSTLTNVNAVRLQSRAISSATPNDNEVLTWNNTTLTWEPRTISTGGITALTGEVIASGSGSVAATIAENAITSAKINNTGNTQNRLLITDSTSGATVTYATCALNQILKWNSTGWECATDSNTGVSSVSSANTDISVANGSTTPVLTLNSGTTGGATDANKIAKLSASGLLAAAMIPDFAASKITSGVLPIARGGTNSGTTLNNNRVMISSGGAIVENAAITASRALASDANGLPVASSVTSTELGYVSGVTSSIQTQLNSKQASLGYTPVNKAGDTMTGALTLPSNGLNVGTTQLVVSGGSVGVGTSSPKAQLDVNGGVRLGNDTATCDSTKKGTIRFTGTSFQACDGSSWFTLATPGGLTPAGAVTAMSTATCPSGYLSANGTAVSRTTYPDLFTAIGVMYGSGDGSTTFNLPDYRGEFLRGWDNGAGRDPDAASRTNRGDSTTGDNVGTKQGDNMIAHTHSGSTLSGVTSVDGAHTHAATGLTATASSAGAHTHTFSATGSFNDNTVTGTNGSWDKENNNGSLIQKLTVSTVANSVSVSGTTSSDGAHTHTITMGGSVASAGAHSHTVTISGSTGSAGAGTETRPRNVNVLYCIKY